MNKSRNLYEIMGLPEDASAAEIKKKYRELVRLYHPDVAGNKAEAHRMFLLISEAYEILSDTYSRDGYDTALRQEREKEQMQADQLERQRRARHTRTYHTTASPEKKKAAAQLVKSAQMAFIQRNLDKATNKCKEAIAIDPRNARAHAVLGDIYKIRGKKELAIKHYSFALQFNPSDSDVERKFNEMLSIHFDDYEDDYYGTSATRAHIRGRINGVGSLMLGGLFFSIKILQGQKFVTADNTIVRSGSFNPWLLAVLFLIGFVVGAIFAANRWVGRPSDLFSIGRLVEGGGIPLGFIAFVISFLSFWLTATIYFTVAMLRGDASRSVLRLIGVSIGVIVLAGMIYNSGQFLNIVFWTGNVVFPASVLGWYCGNALNPIKRYA